MDQAASVKSNECSKIKLWSYWRSSCSWRVRIALEWLKCEYDILPVHLVNNGGEQHSSEFAKINPVPEIPAISIDGHDPFAQSMAILEYLHETRSSSKRSLLPLGNDRKTAHLRAQVRQFTQIIASGIQPIQNLRVLIKVGPEKKMEWGKYWIHFGFLAIEKMLKETSGKFCFGDTITMADMCLIPQIYNARRFSVDMSEFPTILSVEANLVALPEFVAAHPDQQIDAPDSKA